LRSNSKKKGNVNPDRLNEEKPEPRDQNGEFFVVIVAIMKTYETVAAAGGI
jgi:hypothetical protein